MNDLSSIGPGDAGDWLSEALAGRLDGAARSTLGDPGHWPEALRGSLGLILQSGFPMFVVWGEARILLYNQAYAPILADKHPAAFGRPFFETWPEVEAEVGPLIAQAYAGRSSFHEDLAVTLVRGGRSERSWFTFSYSPVRGADGAVAGALCVCIETTRERLGLQAAHDAEERQKRIEAELRESESRLRIAQHAGQVGSFELLPESKRIVVSEEFCRLWGVPTVTEAPVEHFLALILPEDRNLLATGRSALPEHALDYVEYRIVRPDTGETRWMARRGEPVTDPATGRTRYLGVSYDITDRKTAEIELLASEARLRESEARQTFLLALGDRLRRLGDPGEVKATAAEMLGRHFGVARAGYGEVDPSGEIVRLARDWTNGVPSLEGEVRLLDGFGTEIVDELRAGRILRVDDRDTDPRARGEGVAAIWDSIQLRAVVAVPLVKEGRFVAFFYLHEPAPRHWTDAEIVLAREVAERTWGAVARARAERAVRELNETLESRVAIRTAELEQAQEALRQSQKLESMGQLTGGVAHDFNNLLTPIIGALDMLQRKGVGGDREQRLLGGALQSAERAKTLVQRLLAFARRQPLQPRPIDVGRLIEEMAGLVASTTGPQIRIGTDVAPDLPLALGDANQIEMAILNLAVNARDAMPDGGALTISAAACETPPALASRLAPGRYIVLSVLDTGCGMDEATLARAIEPFFSTKGIGKGTGLGLSMVHGLAGQLGGTLTIASRPGLGTRVELWLPIAEAPLDEASGSEENGRPGRRRGRVLLIDDEDLARLSTAEMLIEIGYATVEAVSAEQALAILAEDHGFDLVLSDHLMPGMSGAELARTIAERWPALPVLLITGYAEAEALAPDLPRLNKPFRQAELWSAIEPLV